MKQTAVVIFRTVIILLAGITIGIIISNGSFSGRRLDIYSDGGSKVGEVLHLLKNNYVDSVNTDTLEEQALDQMLQSLDPHSLYLPPQQAQTVNERLEGGFNGVGISYMLLRDTLAVTQVYTGGPADKAGLQSGDKIITLNRKPFAGTHLTLPQVSKLFEGEPGSPVTLGVMRWNNDQLKEYRIKRGHVILSSLDAAYITAPAIGYIKISKFASTTDTDFKSALQSLKAKGMQQLLLDLRGNGGGYLNAATALADEFLPKDKLIVYTQGLHERRTDYFSSDSGLFQQGKIALLIDEHSASASEILAGALQDLDRGIIVGRRSFGKGLVQEQFPFSDGSVINLTVARYYTPSGRSIQKSYRGGTAGYRHDLEERAHSGELYGQKNRYTDSLLKASSNYHTAAGKKVYSGGGIMPDILVPENPVTNTPLVRELNRGQLFTGYAIDRMQPLLARYPSAADFAARYQISDTDFTAFITYAAQTLRPIEARGIHAAKIYLGRLIKANAIQLKWGTAAYYQYLNSEDMDVMKAVAAVKENV